MSAAAARHQLVGAAVCFWRQVIKRPQTRRKSCTNPRKVNALQGVGATAIEAFHDEGRDQQVRDQNPGRRTDLLSGTQQP